MPVESSKELGLAAEGKVCAIHSSGVYVHEQIIRPDLLVFEPVIERALI